MIIDIYIFNFAENEKEFDYIEGGEKGPGHWGDIKQEWSACKIGSMQSPIDMSNQRVKIILKSVDLNKNYKPSNTTVKNRGHDISVINEINHFQLINEALQYPNNHK